MLLTALPQANIATELRKTSDLPHHSFFGDNALPGIRHSPLGQIPENFPSLKLAVHV